jgi:hypothetical protein
MRHIVVNITIEPFTRELADEGMHLAQKSWDECSEIKKDTCAYHGQRGLQIDPDIDQFLYLSANDSLIAVTLRDNNGGMRGYALALLYRSLHLKTELCANIDTFYVEKYYRPFMTRFIYKIEAALKDRGVSIIGWPVTMAGDMYKILRHRGYIADDVVMELKLRDIKKE